MKPSSATPTDEDPLASFAEINVTPFIDVILVLLIVFMIAAPLSTVDIPVDLPSSATAAQPRPNDPIYITLKADLTLAVGENPTDRTHLSETLNTASAADNERRLFIRADQAVPYGEIIRLLNELRASGYSKVALVALASAQ